MVISKKYYLTCTYNGQVLKSYDQYNKALEDLKRIDASERPKFLISTNIEYTVEIGDELVNVDNDEDRVMVLYIDLPTLYVIDKNAKLHDIFMGSSYRNTGRNFKHDIISLAGKLETHHAC